MSITWKCFFQCKYSKSVNMACWYSSNPGEPVLPLSFQWLPEQELWYPSNFGDITRKLVSLGYCVLSKYHEVLDWIYVYKSLGMERPLFRVHRWEGYAEGVEKVSGIELGTGLKGLLQCSTSPRNRYKPSPWFWGYIKQCLRNSPCTHVCLRKNEDKINLYALQLPYHMVVQSKIFWTKIAAGIFDTWDDHSQRDIWPPGEVWWILEAVSSRSRRRKLFAQRFGVDRPLSGKHTYENDDLSGSSATG